MTLKDTILSRRTGKAVLWVLKIGIFAGAIITIFQAKKAFDDSAKKFDGLLVHDTFYEGVSGVLYAASGEKSQFDGCTIDNPIYDPRANITANQGRYVDGATIAADRKFHANQGKIFVNRNEILREIPEAVGGAPEAADTTRDEILRVTAKCGDHGSCRGYGWGTFETYRGSWSNTPTAGPNATNATDIADPVYTLFVTGDRFQRQTCICDAKYVLSKDAEGGPICVYSRHAPDTTTEAPTTATGVAAKGFGQGQGFAQLSANFDEDKYYQKIRAAVVKYFTWRNHDSDGSENWDDLSHIYNESRIDSIINDLNADRLDQDPIIAINNRAAVGRIAGSYQELGMLARTRSEVSYLLKIAWILLLVGSLVIVFTHLYTDFVRDQRLKNNPILGTMDKIFIDYAQVFHLVYSACMWASFVFVIMCVVMAWSHGQFGDMYSKLTQIGVEFRVALADNNLKHLDESEGAMLNMLILSICSMAVHLGIAYGAALHGLTAVGKWFMDKGEAIFGKKSDPVDRSEESIFSNDESRELLGGNNGYNETMVMRPIKS